MELKSIKIKDVLQVLNARLQEKFAGIRVDSFNKFHDQVSVEMKDLLSKYGLKYDCWELKGTTTGLDISQDDTLFKLMLTEFKDDRRAQSQKRRGKIISLHFEPLHKVNPDATFSEYVRTIKIEMLTKQIVRQEIVVTDSTKYLERQQELLDELKADLQKLK